MKTAESERLIQDKNHRDLYRRLACDKAAEIGLTPEQWQRMRQEIATPYSADVLMLFAPHQFARQAREENCQVA